MQLFQSIFAGGEVLQASSLLICILVALLVGCIISGVYMLQAKYTVSFVVTLAMLPAMVCVVILMVNGNVGAGVAVAGAFSLVRFRSVPGTAKEIGAIFLAMGAGLILGMGYLGFALLFAVVMCIALLLLGALAEHMHRGKSADKILRITVPEDLNFGTAFDEVFAEYTNSCEVVSVKTSNMGSLYKLQYQISMKDSGKEKEFMDALRCRNGNLEISLSRAETGSMEL